MSGLPLLRMVAALYVQTNGTYYGVPGVDPWDKARDARTYAGPFPVVAHPPCERWGSFWYGGPMNHKKGIRFKKGDDGGCFAAALAAVKRWGKVYFKCSLRVTCGAATDIRKFWPACVRWKAA